MMLKSVLAGSVLCRITTGLVTKDGVTGRLPALGWNSWNEYACNINESVFLTVGNLLVSTGLKDLGYEYVNIDDCWSDKVLQRDNVTMEIIPDSVKFPNGIKNTADKIHELGLKIGIYSDAGSLTCGGYVGSLGHEELDAKTFASWGIDYLKYDNCNVPSEWKDEWRWWPELWRGGGSRENQSEGAPGETSGLAAPAGYDWSTSNTSIRYRTMRDALAKQEHVIQYSQCAWGHAHVDRWGNATGHSWRILPDIFPQWSGEHQGTWGITPIVNHAAFFANATNFWGHSDYDMLEVGRGNLTYEENRSHFALWAALKSPLIIGTPLHNIKPEILAILKTRDLIAFNQDPIYGESAAPYKWGINPQGTWNQTHPAEYWVGPSSAGLHIFMLNTLNETVSKAAVWKEVPGLSGNGTYRVHDMWTGQDLGVFSREFRVDVKPHDTAAITIQRPNGTHPSPIWKRPVQPELQLSFGSA